MAIRAVLFDLGNTLWHIPERPPTDEIRRETMRRIFGLLESWGVEPEGDLRFIGRDIRLTVGAADKRAYESDCVSPDYRAVVGEVAASKGLDIDDEQSEQLWHTWNLPGKFFGRRLFDDTIDTLETLRGRGLQLGCVTNRAFGGPAFHEEVAALGLSGLLDAMSVSCEVGYMKPHEQLYRHALEALDVDPAEALMVGDSLRADVAGAQALGMTAVWRKHHAIKEDIDGVEPDFAIEHLRELPDLPCFRNGAR